MTDYKTMRVPEAAWADAKAAKRDGETWGDYLRRCVDVEADSTDTPGVVESSVDTDEIARKVVADLEATLPAKVAEELR